MENCYRFLGSCIFGGDDSCTFGGDVNEKYKQFKGKKILVLGLAKSGYAAAELSFTWGIS